MKTLLGIVFFVLLGLHTQAQGVSPAKIELSDVGAKLTTKNDASPAPANSITLVSTINSIATYAVVNGKINRALFNSAAKRDEITALPGFVDLGLSTDDMVPMTVRMYSEYADEYLSRYFGKTSAIRNTN